MKRGFTLIEVLVVIAIIGIIISAAWKVTDANRAREKETSVVEHVKATKFPVRKDRADSVIEEAWFSTTDRNGSSYTVLWLRSKDGDLVAVPSGKAMELLKKLIRRGRNP